MLSNDILCFKTWKQNFDSALVVIVFDVNGGMYNNHPYGY